jgi:hypothetical protein
MRPRASVAAWIIAEDIDLSEAGLERYVAGKFCTFRSGPAPRSRPLLKRALKMAKPDAELQFYGPVPSAVSRWLLLMFWPTAVLMACLAWWLN